MRQDPAVADRLDKEAQPANRIVVPAGLSKPHPTVRATSEAMSGLKPDDYGMVRPEFTPACAGDPAPLTIRVSPKLKARALLIADTLIKAMEARGYNLNPGSRPDPRQGGRGTAPAFEIDGGEIDFAIDEKADRIEHVPSARELADMQRWSWRTHPKWDYAPSGKLSLVIEQFYSADGIRRRWSDARGRVIEDSLNDIVVAFVEIGAARRRDREEQARRHAEWQEQVRLRQEAEQRQRVEEARRSDLEVRAERWSKAETIRRFISDVERLALTGHGDVSPDIAAWLSWAKAHADRVDPLARGIAALLREQDEAANKHTEPASPWARQAV